MSAMVSAPTEPDAPTSVVPMDSPLGTGIPIEKRRKSRRKRERRTPAPVDDGIVRAQQQNSSFDSLGPGCSSPLLSTVGSYQQNVANAQGSLGNLSSDWSATGRGSHIDFGADEVVPLRDGRFLGKGGLAWVHETTVRGEKLALKKMAIRRRIDTSVIKEIEVLKKLSHAHMIRLIGTYTHQRVLGILLHPVAVCDLSMFFEDAAAYRDGTADDNHMSRLTDLGYFVDRLPNSHENAWPIYSQIGCLVSAIAYLHSQKIRHKDLKPSNILLCQGRLYLSDFGMATDFSLLTQSATEGGGGTPRYLAPEVR